MKRGYPIEQNSFAVIKRSNMIETPILRHFIKQHDLDPKEALLLGVLIEVTNQMKTELKTSYEYLSEETGLQKIDIYRGLNSLHRFGILQYKTDRKNLLHIGFSALTDDIEEISLAYKNAEKIRELRQDVDRLSRSNFVPRDELFDAVYPLAGEIIAKKISEAFISIINYINEKLEKGLSIAALKYRLKSLVTGIPQSELLLLDTLPFIIDEILMIERVSGILISCASRGTEEKVDRDMTGGMLTAINDFVATAFSGETKKELDEIRYGKYRIIIRSSKNFYLAFVVRGAPSFEFLNMAESLASGIQVRFRDRLKKFTGDTSSFAETVPVFEEFMSGYNTPPPPVEKAVSYRKLKTIAYSLAAVILFLVADFSYDQYIDTIHENVAMQKLKETVPANKCETEVDCDGGTVTVHGYASDMDTIRMITSSLASLDFAKKIDTRVLLTDFSLIREYSARIEKLTSRIDELETETARRGLETIKIEFALNETRLNSTSANNADRAVSVMKRFPSIKISLAAFSDYNGPVKINRQLAESRMSSIASYMVSRGIAGDRIRFIEFDPDYVKNDPRVISSPSSRGIVIYASTGDD